MKTYTKLFSCLLMKFLSLCCSRCLVTSCRAGRELSSGCVVLQFFFFSLPLQRKVGSSCGCTSMQRKPTYTRSSQESPGANTASLNCTCCRCSDLLHVGLQHVRVPRAVRIEFGVKTGADVLGRHVSPSRIAGCDFGVPVWNKDVVPVNVFAVHMWVAVPGVVKNMNIIKYSPLGTEVGQNCFGVAASREDLTRGRGSVTGHRAPVHLPPCHRQELQARSKIREAVTRLQGPQSHHGPKDK